MTTQNGSTVEKLRTGNERAAGAARTVTELTSNISAAKAELEGPTGEEIEDA